jgi:hypothetical protein
VRPRTRQRQCNMSCPSPYLPFTLPQHVPLHCTFSIISMQLLTSLKMPGCCSAIDYPLIIRLGQCELQIFVSLILLTDLQISWTQRWWYTLARICRLWQMTFSCRLYFHQVPSRYRNSAKFITAMSNQFPILERVYIFSRTDMVLPVTFQAPNLRHFRLMTIPFRSDLLYSLVLSPSILFDIPPSAYFPASYILARLSVTRDPKHDPSHTC